MVGSTILRTLALAAGAAAKILYAGVDESGGEFGVYSSTATPGTGLPGTYGQTYEFANLSTIDIYVNQNKINVFRVAFLLERMCPLEYGLGARFNETHYDLYANVINHITVTKGAYALLDPHNYMRYGNPSQQPGSGAVIGSNTTGAATTAQFAAFWGELARRFVNNEKVIFGLMNEPHDMPTTLVLENDNAAIAAIRSVGARQLILAPGNGYTGGHSWLQYTCSDCEPNSDYMYMLKDPLNNTALDVHEYLDYDFSGQHQVCNQSGPANLAGLTSWLQQYQLKAFISEFGGDNNTQCAQYITSLLTYLEQNDEYIGWSAWAAGPLWGQSAPCCNDGAPLGSLEPNVPAGGGGLPLYNTVWLPVIQPLVPHDLKQNGISSLSDGNAGAH